jgi:hypothetical protein
MRPVGNSSALSLSVYGTRNCTGPLSPWTRTSVRHASNSSAESLEASSSSVLSSYADQAAPAVALVNTRGYCTSILNSSVPCFTSWRDLRTANITIDSVCASGECRGMPAGLHALTQVLNTVFSLVFFTEMLLKVVGLGPWEYTSRWTNAFDGAIAIVGFVEVVVSSSGGSESGIGALRTFRH